MKVEGEKIRLIRQSLRWQQTYLATRLGLQQPHLSDMEAGTRPVPEHVATSLHFLTGFTRAFFSEKIRADVPVGSDLWYRKAKNKYRKSEGSQAYCQLVFDVFEPLTANLKSRPPRLTRLRGCDPEDAALHVRNALGIRAGAPIDNLSILAETAGVRLVGIGIPELRIDSSRNERMQPRIDSDEEFIAFSFWSSNGIPVIFVRTGVSNDQYNWAIAHELIHLVMHNAHDGTVREAEREAQIGASELLLPSATVQDNIGYKHSVTHLSHLAARWNVSFKSIVLRANELGLMNDANMRYYIGAANKGAGKAVSIKAQKPRFYRQMCEVVFGKPIPLNAIAKRTGASRQFIFDVLSAHSGKAEDLGQMQDVSSGSELHLSNINGAIEC